MKYIPIDCGLHDYLEIACSSNMLLKIENREGISVIANTRNVFTQNKAEWLTIIDPHTAQLRHIRLDHIHRLTAMHPNPHFNEIVFPPTGEK